MILCIKKTAKSKTIFQFFIYKFISTATVKATNPQKPPDYHFLAEKTYEAIKELEEVKKLLPSPVAMTAEKVKNPVPKGSKGKSKSRSKKKSDVEKNVPRNLKQSSQRDNDK
uniref:Uncharacterized protein n=1 Tax=Wuchereria bancrofti TaxID=6293 RepID=A0A1I8ED71_WUCBA